jgi:hypothetical protein
LGGGGIGKQESLTLAGGAGFLLPHSTLRPLLRPVTVQWKCDFKDQPLQKRK